MFLKLIFLVATECKIFYKLKTLPVEIHIIPSTWFLNR